MKNSSVPFKKDDFVFIPLGGSNEIGRNMNLYHYNGSWICIDCGSGFPDPQIFPGSDITISDPSFLIQNNIKIDYVIITHAHEDHIGALPYLCQNIFKDANVYLTKFAANFLKSKMLDFPGSSARINEIKNGSRMNIGEFDIEFVGITHSIPEMQGVVIRTPKGNVFHTGDWKIDDNPVVGDTSQKQRIAEIADSDGFDAMVCDSTNVFVKGRSMSEGCIEENLYNIMSECKKLIVVSTFASNVARLETICRVASKLNRKICLAGSSLLRITSVAHSSGYLKDHSFADIKDVTQKNRNKFIVIATGCQGEPLASIAKMANGSHRFISFNRDDICIISAKIIAGNEKKISRYLNKFSDMGVRVITEQGHNIHASGHPCREDLKEMYSIAKPKTSIPVHGEPMHIEEHCIFAKSIGIPNSLSIRDGDVIRVTKDQIMKVGKVFAGNLISTGKMLIDEKDPIIFDRLKIMNNGCGLCSFVLDKKNNLISQVEIAIPGCLHPDHDQNQIDSLKSIVEKTIKKNRSGSIPKIKAECRSEMLKFIRQKVGLSPLLNISIFCIK